MTEEILESYKIRCDSFANGLTEAWTIINVLHMNSVDEGHENWERALNWLKQWEAFKFDPEK